MKTKLRLSWVKTRIVYPSFIIIPNFYLRSKYDWWSLRFLLYLAKLERYPKRIVFEENGVEYVALSYSKLVAKRFKITRGAYYRLMRKFAKDGFIEKIKTYVGWLDSIAICYRMTPLFWENVFEIILN